MDFTEKYNLYKKTVFRIAYSYMGNFQDAEDIMQNAFLKLMECKKEFPEEEDEKRWLVRVTVNLSINEKRKFWNRFRKPLEEAEGVGLAGPDLEVQEALNSLNPGCRMAVYLHYVEGYPVSETAKILGISESAAKMRLKRARERLKLEFGEQETK